MKHIILGFCSSFYVQNVVTFVMFTRYFYTTNPPSRTMALGLTQPLKEMSTKNLPGGKGRPARKTDNLTAICDLSRKMWGLDVS
jgi:hypothetical protein